MNKKDAKTGLDLILETNGAAWVMERLGAAGQQARRVPAMAAKQRSLAMKFQGKAALAESKAEWCTGSDPEISFKTLHKEKAAVWQFCSDALLEMSRQAEIACERSGGGNAEAHERREP